MFKTSLLLLMLSLTASCAETVIVLKPPSCPTAGAAVADDAARLRPLGMVALRDWLGAVQRHCEAIEAMRDPA